MVATDCGICFEKYKDPLVINCGHTYCCQCLIDYHNSNSEGKCPLCRVEITNASCNFTVRDIIEDKSTTNIQNYKDLIEKKENKFIDNLFNDYTSSDDDSSSDDDTDNDISSNLRINQLHNYYATNPRGRIPQIHTLFQPSVVQPRFVQPRFNPIIRQNSSVRFSNYISSIPHRSIRIVRINFD